MMLPLVSRSLPRRAIDQNYCAYEACKPIRYQYRFTIPRDCSDSRSMGDMAISRQSGKTIAPIEWRVKKISS